MNSEIQDLLDQLDELPYGETRFALAAEALRQVDLAGDDSDRFRVRQSYISAAIFGGYPDQGIVAFSWCLAKCDQAPGSFSESELLWSYKWILSGLVNFHQIPLERIDGLFADAETRFIRNGLSLRTLKIINADLVIRCGNLSLGRKLLGEALALRRDTWSDCRACEASNVMDLSSLLGEWERALEYGANALKGRLKCAEEPHRILALALLPLLNTNRIEEARLYQKQGYALVRGKRVFIKSVAKHLLFLTLTGQFTAAIRAFDTHLALGLDAPNPATRFQFILAGQKLLSHLVDRGGETLAIGAAHRLPIIAKDHRVSKRDLLDWLEREAQTLAAQFDKRNRNAHHAYLIQKTLALPLIPAGE